MDEAIAAANGRLRAGGVRVRIKRRKQALYLRATLPGKPGTGKDSDRYEVALGVAANPAGMKRAEAEAKRMDSEISLNQFRWENWLRQRSPALASKTVGQWVEEFKAEFDKRGIDGFTRTTWDTDYHPVLNRLPKDAELSARLLYDAIACTKENSRTRLRYCTTLKAFARFAGITLDVKHLKGVYSGGTVEPRGIPEDEVILAARELITDPAWLCLYGYLAAYGLRPSEAWGIDWDSVAESEEGEILVISSKNRKQEKRLCYPVHPHWWEEWGLRDGRMPETARQSNRDRGKYVCLVFRRYGIPFTPYDLRHAFAVRNLMLGTPESITAKWMGHSIKMHTDTYQRWITKKQHQRVFQELKGKY